MNLSRFVIVFALVTAAAVLFPLRRARAAFAPGAAMPGAPAAPRGPMRRRPNRPRALPTVQASSERHEVNASTAAPRIGKARRRFETSEPRRDSAGHHATECCQSVNKASCHDAPGGDAGDCVVDAAQRPSRQDQISSPSPTSTVTAVTQAVAKVPKPPPKHARC